MSYQLIEKLKSLKPYDPIYGEYKIRLDANESFLHLDAETIQKITDGIAKMDFNRYPDHNAAIACNAFAQFYGVDAQYVTVGNGLDESISLLISCFLNKGDTLMILAPDFAMYEIYARLYEVEPYVYQKGEDLTIDVEDVIAKAKAKNVQMLMFSNPCNPTSIGLDKQDVIRLIEALPDTLVVVDEAYMDFWDEGMSMLKSAHTYPNLMVLRTCSKAVGSASIRMGFVVSDFTNTKNCAKTSPKSKPRARICMQKCWRYKRAKAIFCLCQSPTPTLYSPR